MYKKIKLLIIFLILLTSCSHNPVKTSFSMQQELLLLHIKERNAPLDTNPKLMIAAQKHAEWMAKNNILSHTGENNTQPWDRALKEGYHYVKIGENIATGSDDVNDVMKRWMKSTWHRRNILSDYQEVGIGVASNKNTTYFVVLFGSSS